MAAADTPLLSLEGVDVCYGAIHALRDVSLNVRKGEVVTLLGANGAVDRGSLIARLRSGLGVDGPETADPAVEVRKAAEPGRRSREESDLLEIRSRLDRFRAQFAPEFDVDTSPALEAALARLERENAVSSCPREDR